MTRSFTFAFPGRLELNTGGYAYDRRVIAEIAAHGWQPGVLPLGSGFPAPDDGTLSEAEKRLSALPDDTIVVIDGLAFGILDGWASREARRLRIVALVHHPLALETGLDEAERKTLQTRETKALSCAAHVIVTSPATGRELARDYGVPARKITVAIPGTDPGARASGIGGEEGPPLILSIGTLTRRKGHDTLMKALKRIEDLDWHARIIGSRDLDPVTAAALIDLQRDLELDGRVRIEGESSDTREALAQADIFALASRYEGYGMVFAEALSQGLPIVACDAGAVPEVVPKDAGLLVPVDDVEAFAHALRLLLTDRPERLRRAEAAWQAGLALPHWRDTSGIIAGVLETLQ